MSQKQSAKPTESTASNNGVNFTIKNYGIMVVGVILLALGYYLMIGGGVEDPNVFNVEDKYSFTRVTLSPILIILGLAIQIPAIMIRFKD